MTAAHSGGELFELGRGRVARRERPRSLGARPRESSRAVGLLERSAGGAPAISKVTSHARAAAHRRQKIQYLDHSCRYLENERGQRLPVAEAARQATSWDAPHYTYRPGVKRKGRYSTQVVVSFPAGTDPRVVEYVARGFAMEHFAGH